MPALLAARHPRRPGWLGTAEHPGTGRRCAGPAGWGPL